jgi:Family of unknown function (DUF6172)
MKKLFPLQLAGKDSQRVVEAVKNEVRKYVKRERRKSLPEGVDFWDFDCKVGPDKNEPTIKHLAEVTGAIDAIAAAGGTEVYVEILSKPGHRTKKTVEPQTGDMEMSAGGPEISDQGKMTSDPTNE